MMQFCVFLLVVAVVVVVFGIACTTVTSAFPKLFYNCVPVMLSYCYQLFWMCNFCFKHFPKKEGIAQFFLLITAAAHDEKEDVIPVRSKSNFEQLKLKWMIM